MSNADDLRRLAEEVKSAYEARVNFVSENKQGTANLLDTFGKAHKEMADALRSELARIKPELKSAESERKAGVRAHMAAVQSEISEMSFAWKELLTTMQSVRNRTITN